MQYINNIYQPGSKRKRNVILTIFLVIVLVGVYIFFVFNANNKNKETVGTDPNFETYYDAGSGQRVSNYKDQLPEKNRSRTDKITVLGTSSLFNAGVTKFQVNSYISALNDFSKKRENKITESSIDTNSLKPLPISRSSNSEYPIYKFKLKINREEEYDATLNAISIASASLILEKDGNVIYQSEEIDSSITATVPQH